jgi:16S rRNA processing protein RimM
VQLAGISDRDEAALLSGREIVIDREQLPSPGRDSYYWADLEGMAVETVAGLQMGYVDQLLETGSADVMVVVARDSDRQDGERANKRTLVPFLLNEVVLDVDLEARRIKVDWEVAGEG